MKSDIHTPKIKSGFTAPEAYFDTFAEHWFFPQKKADKFVQKAGFSPSEDYFEANAERLFTHIVPIKDRPLQILKKRYWIGIAATIVMQSIIFPIHYLTTERKDNTLEIETYIAIHSSELSDYQLGELLDNNEIENLENEILNNTLN